MAKSKGRPCVVPGCSGIGEPMLVYALDRTFYICQRHQPEIHELDLEALAQALLTPPEMEYTSSMGRIVGYSEIFPEYDDEEEMPAAQAAIRVLSGEFLEERDLREQAVGLVEAAGNRSKRDNRVVWADPYLEPDFSPFMEDEQTLAPYEKPEVSARLERIAPESEGGITAWYAVQVYPGYETKVKANLEGRAKALGMNREIIQAMIPVDGRVSFKDGKKLVLAEKRYPGYVFIEMTMNDDTWNLVRNTPGVIRFVGIGNKPVPIKITGAVGKVRRKSREDRNSSRPRDSYERSIQEITTRKGDLQW